MEASVSRAPAFGPGIYPNMTSETYHGIDACSSSRLKLLKRSPAHCKESIDNPNAHQTPALILGGAIHCAVLEPELFASRYVVRPSFGRTKAELEVKAAWEAANCTSQTISQDDQALCFKLRDLLMAHKLAGPIFKKQSNTEISGIWVDGLTGILCKLRSDSVSEKLSLVVDLKTTEDASPRAFSKAIFDYGYHRQGAWYLDGWKALGVEYRHYCIIAVEKKPPHGIAVYRLNTEGKAIALGRKENTALKIRYANCLNSGQWPSYPEVITDIELPAWAERQIEEEYRHESDASY